MNPTEQKEKETIRLPARVKNLEKLIDFLIAALKAVGVPEKIVSDIHLIVDEGCTNVINYAYPPGEPGDIELSCAVKDGIAAITIRDWGAPFDPINVAAPDLSLDIDERPIGGLGVFLMKKFSDRLEYRRKEDTNLLTIIKKYDQV